MAGNSTLNAAARAKNDEFYTRLTDIEDYDEYYNYDGIDVAKVADIPCDYAGHMGVPDGFLEVFNPEQFELIGLGTEVPKTLEHKAYKSMRVFRWQLLC